MKIFQVVIMIKSAIPINGGVERADLGLIPSRIKP